MCLALQNTLVCLTSNSDYIILLKHDLARPKRNNSTIRKSCFHNYCGLWTSCQIFFWVSFDPAQINLDYIILITLIHKFLHPGSGSQFLTSCLLPLDRSWPPKMPLDRLAKNVSKQGTMLLKVLHFLYKPSISMFSSGIFHGDM